MEFGTYTLLTKLTPGDNCHGWSPTILRMVTHQPKVKVGHPQEGCVLQTWNMLLRLDSENESQVITAMDGPLPSPGWSPSNSRMVTHQKKFYFSV